MTRIPNNVIRPPKGYEYVTVNKKMPIVQSKEQHSQMIRR
jgi:hypothetical protein